jgi:hypothetical protein
VGFVTPFIVAPRAIRIASAMRAVSGLSRSGVPDPLDSRPSHTSRSTSLANATCWNPSSSTCTVAPACSSARRPARYRCDDTATTTPGSARASINGSSPARSTSARIRVPSLTSTTPSCGSARRYPRLRIAGRSPRSRRSAAIAQAIGVLPLPPKVRLPTLTTGCVSRRRASGCRAYQRRRARAAAW